jgi:hypothetical protein
MHIKYRKWIQDSADQMQVQVQAQVLKCRCRFRCKGAEVQQRCKGAEVQQRCKGAAEVVDVSRCRSGPEVVHMVQVQRCRGAEVQRCRCRCRCRCRGAKMQRWCISGAEVQCQLITMANYNIAKSANCLHKFSLHDINNAFSNLPFVDIVHGMFGCVPAKMLNVSWNGIMQYQLKVINSIIGAGSNKQTTLHCLDILHQNLVKDAALQSECDMPQMSDRNGVTDGSKMTACEHVRNLFIFYVLYTPNIESNYL